MVSRSLNTTAAIMGRPIHAMLVSFPIVCFTLALLTDLAYWQTGILMWQHFSSWLLLAGLVMGGLAAIAGCIDLIGSARIRAISSVWVHAAGNVVVLALALVNSLVHAGDGWTAVVPWGLALSAATVLIMLVTSWLGSGLVHRHGVGVSRHD
ncbi:hypothetical protein DSM14862_04154 (plasmid) [Sulfitobacter indolifex]|uniref:Hypothetical membrane protein n=1 Tax=Sulfitobacter indolifex HEL-45 TaxID=391624 RepID=A0ABP2D4W7_9RHOB|nr:DUF2231 domain-containing protein [Sulfitobacter indolifex]EDQ03262.1 hypothetical membrane protein [Sulfitobacter indolifex HEL-45]UOA21314.1 hypothetical protein DSM14862_04154 [Sulfitobacter indolifex]